MSTIKQYLDRIDRIVARAAAEIDAIRAEVATGDEKMEIIVEAQDAADQYPGSALDVLVAALGGDMDAEDTAHATILDRRTCTIRRRQLDGIIDGLDDAGYAVGWVA